MYKGRRFRSSTDYFSILLILLILSEALRVVIVLVRHNLEVVILLISPNVGCLEDCVETG